MTAAQPSAVHAMTSSDDDNLTHWACCRAPHLALCGVDVSDDPQSDDYHPDCVACDDLDWSDTCPLYGPGGCRGSGGQ